jgi:hypothetical protein
MDKQVDCQTKQVALSKFHRRSGSMPKIERQGIMVHDSVFIEGFSFSGQDYYLMHLGFIHFTSIFISNDIDQGR